MKIRAPRKFLISNFALSDVEDSRAIKYKKNSKFTFYRFTKSIRYAISHVGQISGKQYVFLFYLHI